MIFNAYKEFMFFLYRAPFLDKLVLFLSLFFLMIIIFIPNYYTRLTVVPAFDDLYFSEGVAIFENRGKSGWLMSLKTKGDLLEFRCRNDGRNLDCFYSDKKHKELQNSPAKVWWFERPFLFRTNLYAAQIEINGAVVRDYTDTLSIIESSKKRSIYIDVVFVFVFVFCVFRRVKKFYKESKEDF